MSEPYGEPPGWYRDANDPEAPQRYWDGNKWVDNAQARSHSPLRKDNPGQSAPPLDQTVLSPPTSASQSSGQAEIVRELGRIDETLRSIRRIIGFVVVLMLLLGVLSFVAVSGGV